MFYLDFPLSVVFVDIHEVQNKELQSLTEMSALQSGEIQKNMNRNLRDVTFHLKNKKQVRLYELSLMHMGAKLCTLIITSPYLHRAGK